MLTGEEYRSSLADGRLVYYRGREVDDVRTHPRFTEILDEVAAGYDDCYDPDPHATNPALRAPRSIEEMREQGARVQELDLLLGTTYQSINALLIAGERLSPDAATIYLPRIRAYVDDATRRDIRIAECITDAKGDRTKHPADQSDPDSYVRVVDRRPGGVVIRGAKLHISAAAVAHELLVLPTKTMRPGEEDYAVACAVPANAAGVHIATSGYGIGDRDARDYPSVGRQHAILQNTCIFDDVFVPHDRVFLNGETSQAAVFAHALGLWERLGGLSHMVMQADQLVGLAQLVAEANGTARVAHVREKIDEMLIHATLLRAGLEAAVTNARATTDGYYYPDDLYTNVAKYQGATQYSHMVRNLHDIAGGSVVTAPSMADFDHPVLGPLVDKYMATSPEVSGTYRTALFHAIRDMTADATGGWWAVSHLQGGGGLFAQRLVSRRLYDMGRAKGFARQISGLDEEGSDGHIPSST